MSQNTPAPHTSFQMASMNLMAICRGTGSHMVTYRTAANLPNVAPFNLAM
mgnify:CR=1 FL=1